MLLVTALCLVLAVLVLRSRRAPVEPNSSRLYRIDNRAIASILVVLAAVFAVLAVTSGKLLL